MPLASTHNEPSTHALPVITAPRAYLELLSVYGVVFGPLALMHITRLLAVCGVIDTTIDRSLFSWLSPLYVWIAAAGWCAALALAEQDIRASARGADAGHARWSDRLTARQRNGVRTVMLLSLPLCVCTVLAAHTIMSGRVLWLWIPIAPGAALIVLVLDRHGVSLAAIGLQRREADAEAGGQRAFAASLAGVIASALIGVGLAELASTLDPGAPAAWGRTASTSVVQPLGVRGLIDMLLLSLAAGLAEELLLTALLVTLLEKAGQPRRRWIALAVLLRLSFHLSTGIFASRVVLFTIVNTLLFARTRLILPIIAAHALFDMTGYLNPYIHIPFLATAFPGSQQLSIALAVIPLLLAYDRTERRLRANRRLTTV